MGELTRTQWRTNELHFVFDHPREIKNRNGFREMTQIRFSFQLFRFTTPFELGLPQAQQDQAVGVINQRMIQRREKNR